jgi:FkbM family methyltransferase
MLFFNKKQENANNHAVSVQEVERLQGIPRYTTSKTALFNIPIIVNDTCTFLEDIREIIDGGIYKFKVCKDSPFIVDCGSNIGISIIYFKHLFPKAKIVAFEPDPTLFSMLSTNIFNFGFQDVELRQAAIWVNDLGISFFPEGGHSGRISDSEDDENTIAVPSVRLRDLLESVDSIDMLKMDIEGAEADVLLDCGDSLGICDHVFVEYHSREDTNQQLHDILRLFSEMGYRYHIREAFVRRNPFVDRDCLVGMDIQLNLFFVKT